MAGDDDSIRISKRLLKRIGLGVGVLVVAGGAGYGIGVATSSGGGHHHTDSATGTPTTAASDPTTPPTAATLPPATPVTLTAPPPLTTAPPATASPATAPPPTAPPTTSAPALPTPTLGKEWGPHQKGYGDIKPATIDNGGDPTGEVTHVTWTAWGGAKAEGTGTSIYVAPNQIVADGTEQTTTIVAFNLGSCNGVRMYEAIEWYFPQHGQTFSPHNYINICTGQYVGDG